MKPVLVVFAAVCAVIAAESGHAAARGAVTVEGFPPPSPNPAGAAWEARDLTDIDATMPRDPWRNGDPLFVPRQLRQRAPAFARPGTRANLSPIAATELPYAKPDRTWESPLARDLAVTDSGRPAIKPTAPTEPRQAGTAARVLTEVAVFTLGAAGKISGTGRDSTGDIGKPPLGIRDRHNWPGIQGAIK